MAHSSHPNRSWQLEITLRSARRSGSSWSIEREVEQPLADKVALLDRAEKASRELCDYAGHVSPELRDELSGLITPDIENLWQSRGWPSACFAACKCQHNCIHPAICNMLTGDGALRDVIAWRALQPSLLPCSGHSVASTGAAVCVSLSPT